MTQNIQTQAKLFEIKEFPLLSVAITCVIGGLLVVFYYFSTELIKVAEIRNALSKLSLYNQAAQGFTRKYSYTPGDMPHATQHDLASEHCEDGVGVSPPLYPGCNGNGDKALSTYTEHSENINFWYHLHRAGFIADEYDGVSVEYGEGAPLLGVRDLGVLVGMNYSVFGGKHAYALGLADFGKPIYKLTPKQAWIMDSKLDDGDALLGLVRTPKNFDPLCHDERGNYAQETKHQYCVLLVRAEF